MTADDYTKLRAEMTTLLVAKQLDEKWIFTAADGLDDYHKSVIAGASKIVEGILDSLS